MAQQMYRDYSQWLHAMEPRLQWVQLTRAQFRKFAAVLGVVFCLSAVLLISRIAVIKNGYAIVDMRQDRDRLLSQRRQLERRLKELRSLAYAEETARRDLRMKDISPNSVIYLDDPAAALPKRAWRSLFGG